MMTHNLPPDMDPLEKALIRAANAVDSRGLRIHLIRARGGLDEIAAEAMKVINRLTVEGSVALGGDDLLKNELNRAENVSLAADVLLQARVKMVQEHRRRF